MGWFRRAKTRAPEWAAQLDRTDFETFVEEVIEEARVRGVKLTPQAVADGRVQIHTKTVDLAPVVARCAELETFEWAKVIGDALGRRRKKKGSGPKPPTPAHAPHQESFDRIRPSLRLQLVTPASRAALFDVLDSDSLVHERLAEGLSAALVLDQPGHFVNVAPEQLERWGVSRAQAWASALDNHRHEVFETQRHASGILACYGDGDFVAATVLALLAPDSHQVGTHGNVVAVPSWHAILLAPAPSDLRGTEATTLATTMLDLARQLHDASPDRLSDALWFVHQQRWTPFPSRQP